MNENIQTSSKFLKFLQFPLIKILLGFFILITAASIAQTLTQTLLQNKALWANLLAVCLTAGVVGLAYYGFVRWIERRAVSELAFPPSWRKCLQACCWGQLCFPSPSPFCGYWVITK